MRMFPKLLFIVALGIATCAAYFSVKGIGLLFAGSFYPVVVMASALEIGKIFAVSFLYRRWKDITLLLKTYLLSAVVVLVVITSLGIFGFLSDAYQDPKTKVEYYEEQISMLSKQNTDIKERDDNARRVGEMTVDTSNETAERYKEIYDNFAKQQTSAKGMLVTRRGELDAELNDLRSSSGGIFSNKKKKLEEMEALQADERASIQSRILVIDNAIESEYTRFVDKVDRLVVPATKPQVIDNNSSEQIKTNELDILSLKESINNTDIGSFRYIAGAFNITVDAAVKWFMLMIVFVFDPLAMSLVLAYNMYVVRRSRTGRSARFTATETPVDTVIPTQFEKPVTEDMSVEDSTDTVKAKKVVYIRGKKQN